MLNKYLLVPDSELPGEDLSYGGGLHADSLEECAQLCERNNHILAGSYQGAMASGYSFQHCNGFVYDTQRKLCYLKNKRMGNFYPNDAPLTPSCAFYDPRRQSDCKTNSRYVSGYKWRDAINELNDAFPNETSGMQHLQEASLPNWSKDSWGSSGNTCSKQGQYYVQPGALISSRNTTTGPFSQPTREVVSFPVANMQECANTALKMTGGVPNAGVNAWTFSPNYTTQETTDNWPGTCSVGHVREPAFNTLTPENNGSISGFAVSSLSTEIARFLFG